MLSAMPIYLPLAGPNARGLSPKACKVTGWNEPAYKGVDPERVPAGAWLGMRLDSYVVVDCDCACPKVGGRKPDVCVTPDAAYRALNGWLKHINQLVDHTWMRKTPHGFHLIYLRRIADAAAVDSRKLTGISPTLELKTGIGHQIVFRAPGYDTVSAVNVPVLTFDAAWLPPVEAVRPADEWSELPDGIGDSFMISIAGKLREWGADQSTILKCISEINDATMTRSPMRYGSLQRIARSAARYAPGDVAELTRLECPTCSTMWEGS